MCKEFALDSLPITPVTATPAFKMDFDHYVSLAHPLVGVGFDRRFPRCLFSFFAEIIVSVLMHAIPRPISAGWHLPLPSDTVWDFAMQFLRNLANQAKIVSFRQEDNPSLAVEEPRIKPGIQYPVVAGWRATGSHDFAMYLGVRAANDVEAFIPALEVHLFVRVLGEDDPAPDCSYIGMLRGTGISCGGLIALRSNAVARR